MLQDSNKIIEQLPYIEVTSSARNDSFEIFIAALTDAALENTFFQKYINAIIKSKIRIGLCSILKITKIFGETVKSLYQGYSPDTPGGHDILIDLNPASIEKKYFGKRASYKTVITYIKHELWHATVALYNKINEIEAKPHQSGVRYGMHPFSKITTTQAWQQILGQFFRRFKLFEKLIIKAAENQRLNLKQEKILAKYLQITQFYSEHRAVFVLTPKESQIYLKLGLLKPINASDVFDVPVPFTLSEYIIDTAYLEENRTLIIGSQIPHTAKVKIVFTFEEIVNLQNNGVIYITPREIITPKPIECSLQTIINIPGTITNISCPTQNYCVADAAINLNSSLKNAITFFLDIKTYIEFYQERYGQNSNETAAEIDAVLNSLPIEIQQVFCPNRLDYARTIVTTVHDYYLKSSSIALSPFKEYCALAKPNFSNMTCPIRNDVLITNSAAFSQSPVSEISAAQHLWSLCGDFITPATLEFLYDLMKYWNFSDSAAEWTRDILFYTLIPIETYLQGTSLLENSAAIICAHTTKYILKKLGTSNTAAIPISYAVKAVTQASISTATGCWFWKCTTSVANGVKSYINSTAGIVSEKYLAKKLGMLE